MRRLFFATALTMTLAAAAFGVAEEQKLPVIMVTDISGLDPIGSNVVAWEGVKQAAVEYSCPVSVTTSEDEEDYAANVNEAAGKAKIVVTVGTTMVDAVKRAAAANSATYFVHVGDKIDGYTNVVSYGFKEEESGFLAGVVSGLYTRTGKAAVVVNETNANSGRYEAGFAAGVKSVSASAGKSVSVVRIDAGEVRPVSGGSIALQATGSGCDVAAMLADVVGGYALTELRESPGIRIVWGDVDRKLKPDGIVLANTVKRPDVAVFEGIKSAVDLAWEPGYKELGYREGAITLENEGIDASLGADGLGMLEAAKGLLARGEIVVPTRKEDVVEWGAAGVGYKR